MLMKDNWDTTTGSGRPGEVSVEIELDLDLDPTTRRETIDASISRPTSTARPIGEASLRRSRNAEQDKHDTLRREWEELADKTAGLNRSGRMPLKTLKNTMAMCGLGMGLASGMATAVFSIVIPEFAGLDWEISPQRILANAGYGTSAGLFLSAILFHWIDSHDEAKVRAANIEFQRATLRLLDIEDITEKHRTVALMYSFFTRSQNFGPSRFEGPIMDYLGSAFIENTVFAAERDSETIGLIGQRPIKEHRQQAQAEARQQGEVAGHEQAELDIIEGRFAFHQKLNELQARLNLPGADTAAIEQVIKETYPEEDL